MRRGARYGSLSEPKSVIVWSRFSIPTLPRGFIAHGEPLLPFEEILQVCKGRSHRGISNTNPAHQGGNIQGEMNKLTESFMDLEISTGM
ncbi:hypothetical protein EYC80_005801 [Monilinia laxa]|uniref:Uncharacterized protein n=1 Tax=Monilinia laxa TaxID=61186 RepID=A0A5N6KFC1_MONLA|nr:hypothetical protein EYC80_005801 [Monilinia laxa]